MDTPVLANLNPTDPKTHPAVYELRFTLADSSVAHIPRHKHVQDASIAITILRTVRAG